MVSELPRTMRALVHSSMPGPAGVALREVPVPAPGRGEVVLRVEHAGFNRHDLFTTLRRHGSEEPLVVGADAAGVVAAVGPDVDPGLVGARRLLNPCPGWPAADRVPEHPRILGSAAPGTFAEYVAVPADCLATVPAHLTPAEAGALGLAAVTAYRALFTVGELRAGEHVLIPGIGGGAALLALDMALAAGADVSVSSRSAATGEFAVSRGATRAIPSDAEPAEVLPRPVDLVLDGVGAATVPGGLRALRPGGRLVTFGATTGPDLALSLRETFFRQVSVRGTSMGSAQEFAAMLQFATAHRIRPVVADVRPLADGPAVFMESVEAAGIGKTVFAVGARPPRGVGMTVRKWNPDGMAPPVGAYSHVSVPPPGARLAFVSGQVGAAPDGTIVAGCAAQTTVTFANIERILDELGATPADVVKLFTMLVGEGAFAEFAAARTEVFDRWYPDGRLPAHSAAIVAGLATPEILVEIEAVVAVRG